MLPTPFPWGSPQHSHFTGETREEKAHSKPTAYTSQPSTLSPPYPTHTETQDSSLGPPRL